MRIARFTTGEDPMYGIVQEKDGQDMVYGITGDPLYTEIRPTGTIVPLQDVRLLAPVIPRSKVVCVGRNYAAHAAEMGGEVPDQALFFLKPNTTVVGPGDPVAIPPYSQEVSLEAELAVVMKRMAKDISAEEVPEAVLGYTCANDLTARDSQRAENQWFRAKAFDTSCPIGPWIETDLDVSGPSGLSISSRVDGEIAQDGSTADMVRSVAELIAEISTVVTLLPGDLVLTGTPAGVRTVEAGSSIDITIEGIGTLTNPVVRR
ncbi:fumarylacetoacetate hydrolase family protein [Brachybacterium fresconis]|uniref:2-keto-4-pentenoate hydratase/2-oxohepta-3-ene-1,7-dioic acid hydratase in catechol pathway n=1 Tax=Brachybacterium fresconis TaxID=173363 RepID=A0ABS4YGL0_9MICO|nr:fumarylacetoacetate hydrolase family protein [Brachybacterium fresconis]MBP2407934.1 2-keto-4-pentenoate hydratase/2-oxohepta-3-ene-1,7-dioic acid hydratase in catechol pathway [Brachybacterium fresconis]